MRSFLRQFCAAAIVLTVTAAPLFAQSGAPVSESGETWINALQRIEPGKLAIILIFGSGIIGTLGYSITGIIRALQGRDEETSEELSARVDALEDRLEKLEAQAKTPTPV